MMNSPLKSIPRDLQLEAACTLELRQMSELLESYGCRWTPGMPYHLPDYKHFFTFSNDELLAYLHQHPETCEKLQMHSENQRSSPNTFLQSQGDRYRVGWYESGVKDIQMFDNLEEAAADYVLFTLGFPRLRA